MTMNGLTLRINRGGGGKSKNSMGYSPISIPTSLFENTVSTDIQTFINSPSSDDQLAILKQIIETNKVSIDDDVMKFLVAAFFHADIKHPIKGFLSRHIIKNKHLQQPFSDTLSSQISVLISWKPLNYKQYVDTVYKLLSSIENFHAGVVALRTVQLTVGDYLRNCLECCVTTLREQKTLSPTEKNEIFNLAHVSLRLLLHIIQKASTDNVSMVIFMFDHIRSLIHDLMFDDDVPMDTKSVCGILYVTMHVAEYGPDSWIEILNSSSTRADLKDLLNLEAGRLCLFSALATVVAADHLFTQTVDDCPAIVTLTNKILEIGDRSSSESAVILGVSRTVLQLSKLLARPAARGTALALVRALLTCAWGQLEHHMDSVRHLAAQLLACVANYCAKMDAAGDSEALDMLTLALQSPLRTRKSVYMCVCSLAGAVRVRRLLRVVQLAELIHALADQHCRNTASAALAALLSPLCAECSLEELRAQLLEPCVCSARAQAAPAQLRELERVLAGACARRPDLLLLILSYIKEASKPSGEPCDLKCVLMLVRVSRKSCADSPQCSQREWRGVLSYDLLRQAAIDAVDETRLLSLSLVVECPRSTEQFSEGELSFVLHYLRYNINAQAPNYRQLTLSAMNKFIKRFEESYKVIKRESQPYGMSDKVTYYLKFAEDLRRQCFDSLIPGANYSRRYVALQVLAWCEHVTLEGYERSWEPEYVEKLLLHLEDSYENNKAFALDVLASCPEHLLRRKGYSVSLDIEDIFRQASALKPTECVSAAYKLELLWMRLPDYILEGEDCASRACPVLYAWCARGLRVARAQLCVCADSVLRAAAHAPVYGALHCLARALQHVDAREISSDAQWSALVDDIISTCLQVSAAVGGVVNNSSPEGHLPMDMTVQVSDHGNTGNVTLDDGRQVTSQMVLLCAWRSVKEVSLLLGGICSRLSVRGEEDPSGTAGTLSASQLQRVGEHFTRLLAETKHRGAFEQAYLGFTMLLDRLWRCRSPALHALPRTWLQLRMRALAEHAHCANVTRRSAGVPFMIQALVTTELQVRDNPLCFNSCMSTLLQLMSGLGPARAQAAHVLRALLRHAELRERAAPHVPQALLAALRTFNAPTWDERACASLLLSALVRRVFVSRGNMTGRVFFLRYPELYDFMLATLQQAHTLAHPALCPVLLLLARLYPSSLEGTLSNLKLVAFIPHVSACAASSALHTRVLAARAIVPLIAPDLYIQHIESVFSLLRDPRIKRNHCHGLLLQLVQLLQPRAEPAPCPAGAARPVWSAWPSRATTALWLLDQAGHPVAGEHPCYLIADEFVKLLNLLFMSYPTVPQATVTEISSKLHTLIFETKPTAITAGRDICLANSMNLYLILATRYKCTEITDLVFKGLEHSSYEVVLSVVNYLLILHNDLEPDTCKFHEHLISIADTSILNKIKTENERYIQLLCRVLKSNYLECQEKSLKILMLEGDTQRNIIETKMGQHVTDDMIIEKLIDYVQNELERVTHIYLQSLLNYVTKRLQDSTLCLHVLLDVIRVVFECSSSENSENSRSVVAGFIEANFQRLLELDMQELSEAHRFELQATIWATIITLLEDDEGFIRQRVSDVVCGARVCPAACRPPALLRMRMRRGEGDGQGEGALLALIALLDFQSVVVMADDVSDECRVFDQNERYNIFLEETVWTLACADIIVNEFNINDVMLTTIIDKPAYKETFDKLCQNNVEAFKKMVAGHKLPRSDALNPKIELFVNKLRTLQN